MHGFLRRNHEDITDAGDTVLYGPSTSNQVRQVIPKLYINYSKSLLLH